MMPTVTVEPPYGDIPHRPTEEEIKDMLDKAYGFKDGKFQYYTEPKKTRCIPSGLDFGSPVDHPNHYEGDRKYAPYKVIYDWDLNFNLGNAVKYISRAGRKGPSDKKKEDILKAIEYLQFELELMEEK